MTSTKQRRETPHIDILFLGSPGVGKATFLSRLPHVQHPSIARREAATTTTSTVLANNNRSSLNASETSLAPSTSTLPPSADSEVPPPPYASTTSLLSPTETTHGDSACPLTAPISFNVALFARPYSITIHPSTSQLFTDAFPATPHFLIICFAVNNRASLHNAQHYWMMQFHLHYPASSAKVMLIGLKRDERTAEVEVVDSAEGEKEERYVCVMPEEGLEAARRMRADRYAECSAKTGELMWEVVEDITRTAATTTLDKDYASDMCTIM